MSMLNKAFTVTLKEQIPTFRSSINLLLKKELPKLQHHDRPVLQL